MNNNLPFKFLLSICLLIIVNFADSAAYASNTIRKIIITGKVINSDYGNPVSCHPVNLFSESLNSKSSSYFNLMVTDEEGFYSDTLTTYLEKGSFKVYTYDYLGMVSEKTLYFRFTEFGSSNIFIADFEIDMPFQTNIFQARFKYVQKNAENRHTYQFFDETNSDKIYKWDWDFGDGQYSQLENPEHTFTAEGLYKVRLKISAMIDYQVQISSFSMIIYASDYSFYHMGGHCFAGYFPIDEGKAFLYYVDDHYKYTPIDTAYFDTLGYYYFYEIPDGNYCIKVQPEINSTYYGMMLPTYFGNKAFWEQATIIINNQTNWEYDIQLIEGDGIESGNCSIWGNVSYGDTLFDYRYFPAEGVDFLLMNDESGLLFSQYSDDNGNFSFELIEDGTYWLTADVTGYDRKKKLIHLTDAEPEISNIEIVIENGDINMGIQDKSKDLTGKIGIIYPNPATDLINIDLNVNKDSDWILQMLDTQGKLVLFKNVHLPVGQSTVSFNISELINGTYIFQATTNGKTAGKQIIVNR